jgi:hypothetical protein
VAIIELDNVPWYYPLWGHETAAATIRAEMTKAGYVLEQEHAVLDYQSFQVFRQRPDSEVRGALTDADDASKEASNVIEGG